MIAYILIGWGMGLLCWFMVPTKRRMGLVRFLLVGMVGGVAGGMVGGAFNVQKAPFTVDIPSLVGAFLGGLIAVIAVVVLSRNRAHA
ncbi:hypothetical protein [Hyalangium versicolor]|uniref:hypothetical protein n=1 Tax=Hyalangium versicolor TaxID=2861190 RepID=UPI001CCF9B22|nr:hypothetical protein [Hyalangium versicolor]